MRSTRSRPRSRSAGCRSRLHRASPRRRAPGRRRGSRDRRGSGAGVPPGAPAIGTHVAVRRFHSERSCVSAATSKVCAWRAGRPGGLHPGAGGKHGIGAGVDLHPDPALRGDPRARPIPDEVGEPAQVGPVGGGGKVGLACGQLAVGGHDLGDVRPEVDEQRAARVALEVPVAPERRRPGLGRSRRGGSGRGRTRRTRRRAGAAGSARAAGRRARAPARRSAQGWVSSQQLIGRPCTVTSSRPRSGRAGSSSSTATSSAANVITSRTVCRRVAQPPRLDHLDRVDAREPGDRGDHGREVDRRAELEAARVEDAGAVVGARPQQLQDLRPHLLGVERPGRAHDLERDQQPDRRPGHDRHLRAEHAQVVEQRLQPGAGVVGRRTRRRSGRRRSRSPATSRPTRAARSRARRAGSRRDRRRMVGREHGAPRVGRERLRRVAPHVVERHRVDAAARRDRVAHRHPGDRLPARRLPRDGGVLLEQAEGVRGDVPDACRRRPRRRPTRGCPAAAPGPRRRSRSAGSAAPAPRGRRRRRSSPGRASSRLPSRGGGNGEAGRKRARRRRAGAAPARGGRVRGPARSTGPGRPRSGRARGCPQRRARARSAERPRDRPSRGGAGRASSRGGRRRAARGGRGRGSPRATVTSAAPVEVSTPTGYGRASASSGAQRTRNSASPTPSSGSANGADLRQMRRPAPPARQRRRGSAGRRRRRSARAADGGAQLAWRAASSGSTTSKTIRSPAASHASPSGSAASGRTSTHSVAPAGRQHAASPQS